MTHKDIYTKFMIEYDKANVTSSYPSLTEYEVATVLDKAYHALIAQKVTGNNVRRVALEQDLKSVSDIQPLIVDKIYEPNEIYPNFNNDNYTDIDNTMNIVVPKNFLYYVGCYIKKQINAIKPEDYNSEDKVYNGPIDQNNNDAPMRYRKIPVKLVSHQMAENFKASAYNIPWIKIPVCYIENNIICIVVDSYDKPNTDFCELTYIKSPNKFAKNLDDIKAEYADYSGKLSYFDAENDTIKNKYYTFECNDTVAEELISLAVAFALENVESQRLNSKLNMRGLEA